MMSRATVQNDDSGIVVNVPLTLKKRGGRKEVVLPQAFSSDSPMRPSHQEALVIAIARAHRWQKLLDEGKFGSISDLAREIGLDPSFAARLLRLTLLAPDIVEAILMGEEPSGLSLMMLTKQLPALWDEQRTIFGLTPPNCPGTARSTI
ncbi:hypothetical protein [Thermogutta sp.]|uniref:hypothetical protein n=1 Tax=Thermogutta sp. TaxID=1962930 RepID=UPI0032205A3B